MAIMGIAAVIAVPAVQSGQHQREVRTTLQHFVAAVRQASSKAVLTRRTVELWISTDDDTYALAMPLDRDASEDDQDLDDLERDQARKVIGRIDLPESATFGEVKGGRSLDNDVIAIPFYPTGASGGGEIEFVFESRNARKSYVITIDPLVSSVDLKEES